MQDLFAQIVVAPETLSVLLGAVIGLQAWIVQRLFMLDKKLALIRIQLVNCVCRPDQRDEGES
jgi:hypothetical protein